MTFTISDYHSVDGELEKAPPLDAICARCRSLNFLKIFSGPRYGDFDEGYEKPRFDIFIATLAEIRRSAEQCRICFVVAVFHDAKHFDPLESKKCTNGLNEDLEHCILKPYRADALLHLKDESEESDKAIIATSIALVFQVVQKEKSGGVYSLNDRLGSGIRDENYSSTKDASSQDSTLLQREALIETNCEGIKNDAPPKASTLEPLVEEEALVGNVDSQRASSSEGDTYGEQSPPLKLDRHPYSIHNFIFGLTAASHIDHRSALSVSDSLCGSAIDWCSLRVWLEACESGHPNCRPEHRSLSAENNLRIRCIDVRTSELVPLGFQSRYLTLSYVWGAPRNEMVRHAVPSISEDNSMVVIQDLPPTVRDAIEVTKRLGEQYLWVDCVCIDQNDPATVQEQIDIMDQIYENAVLTIITSTIDNAHERIPGLRRKSRLKSSTDILIDGRVMKGLCARSVVGEFFGIWQDRAWTFQEWILSKRCLLFSTNQILFQCQESSGLESFAPSRASTSVKAPILHFWADPRSSPATVSRLPLGTTIWNFQAYAELVRDYSGRSLTYDSDVLHAFTGIMRKLEHSCGMTFVEGLPRNDLLRALLWSPTNKPIGKFRRRARPSWTWSAFDWKSGYECWEIDEMDGPGTASCPRYEKIVGSKAPSCTRAIVSPIHPNEQAPQSVFLVICRSFSWESYPNLCRAIRYRRADVVLLPESKQSLGNRLLISSETRKLLVHRNPPNVDGRRSSYVYPSKDDVLHPQTKKLLDGRHYVSSQPQRHFWRLVVHVGLSGAESFSSHDAILLYEWDISIDDAPSQQRVVAMIIDRLSDGTVERLSLTAICTEDWYTLPLVSEREDLILV